MSISEKIRQISDMECTGGCSIKQVEEAQKRLGLIFPKEYVEYVTNFGAIDFYGTEWTGLNIEGYFNTVEATLKEQGVNSFFPDKHFVLEDLCIDAKKVIVNEQGQVFMLQYDKIEKIFETIIEYLDSCIKRK